MNPLRRFFDHRHRTRHPRINEDTDAPYFVMGRDGSLQAYCRGDRTPPAHEEIDHIQRMTDLKYSEPGTSTDNCEWSTLADDGNHGDA